MNTSSFLGLMQNAALLLAVAFIFDLIANRWRTGQLLFSQVPVGLAIGAICITIMMTPWIFAPGIVFDTRSVLIGISGLFFGSLTVAIVMGMTAAFRYYQGGAAAWTGIAVILISGVIGIVWRHLRRRPISDISWRELYLFGLVIHLAMLVTMFTLPWQIALQVLSNIALPVIIIYPAGTALLGVLMVNRVRRERSDDALKESEEKYRSLVENINDMIYTLDSSGRFTYVSPVIEKFSSYKASDLVGRNFAEFVHPDDLPGLVENFNLTVQGELNPFEYRILEGDKIRHVRTSSELILKDGVVVGLTGVLTDISEQKQAENGLQKSERQMEDIIEFLPDATLAINREGRVIIWNKAIEEMTGVPAAEMIGKGDYAYTIPFYGEARPQLMDLVFDDQHDIAAKYPQITHEGDTLLIEVFCHALYNNKGAWVSAKASPLHDQSGNIIGAIESIRDITERKQAEQSLHLFKDLVEHSSDAIGMSTPEGKHYYQNEAFDHLFGNIGVHPPETVYVDKAIGRQVFDTIMCGRSWQGEVKMYKKDGTILNIFERAYAIKNQNDGVIGLVGLHTDITDQKQAEEEKRDLQERLNRAEKMEALGTLAGGVAHDLNNILGIVVGYSEMILDEVEETSPLRRKMVNIFSSGQKAAAVVDDLLAMARRGVPGSSILNLNDIIDDCQQSPELAKLSSYHPNVKIITDLEADLLNIAGSPVHLNKSLYNLISNASEAMTKGGTLTIKTANQYLDKPMSGYDEIKEGDYVVLSVSDTGEGISEKDRKRIFEPFYTKKIMGRSGTGLGLAVVWGTVTDHKGYINVQSVEGKGSTFTMYFPVTREEVHDDTMVMDVSAYMGNGQSILLVDDVAIQRELATDMLKKLNYNVESVQSGEEALLYLKDHKTDLIILDMIMDPGMDGLDTYRGILEINPQQKTIIVSGFSETHRVDAAQGLGAGTYVKKPYIKEKLGLAVKKELGNKR